ncbi:MAG: hypothetical protein M1333_02770 [Patescibacteria group bacterium]|nr:hypothetical protein [Patescibacteria group bacterium]
MSANKKYVFIGFAIIIAVALAFGFYKELNRSKQSLVAEVTEKKEIASMIPVWLRPEPDVQKIQSELDTLAEYRAKYYCTTDSPSDVAQCEHYNQRFDQQRAELLDTVHRLQIEKKSPTAVAAATANIRELADNPSLEVKITNILANPYIANGKRVDKYSAPNGMQYLVNAENNQVVEFTFEPAPQQEAPYRMVPQISRAQQRQKAESYLAKHISDFYKVKNGSGFTYTESSKDNRIAAFRWDSNIKLPGGDMVPFIQVVVSPAGDIMSFNDTRSLYE